MTSFRPIFYAALALTVLIGVGVVSFVSLEQKTFIDALWLILTSITAVGYGDVLPSTTAGRAVMMLLILGGIGLLTYILSTIFVGIVEGHISDIWGKRKMMKEISKLKDHIIVCGAGRVGSEVIAELIIEKHDFVVIEKDPAILNELHEEGIVKFIAGNASEDKVLLAAGVANASGVITTLADDAENLMITIACRDFNPKVRIVARANRPESIVRLKRAGADIVVCPSAIAGSRMALASLKPASVAFVQTLIDRGIDLNLEELLLGNNSVLVGKKLKESSLREEYGVMLLAIRRGEEFIPNPGSAERLMAGDLLVLCGSENSLCRLEKVATGEKNG